MMTFTDPLWLRVGAGLALLVSLCAWSHSWRRRRLAKYLGGRTAAGRLAKSNLYRWPVERILLLGIVAMATAAAAAGPVWNVPPPTPPPPPPVRSVLIALDISASMQATDVDGNRLAGAVASVEELLSALAADRVGLMLFAGTPYPLVPPTHDHRALRYLLQGVTSTIASAHDPGSLPSAAINEGIEVLNRWSPTDDERAIILISDGEAGEGMTPIEAAARAAGEAGVAVHAIGVGTATGAGMVMPTAPYQLGGRILDASGSPAVSRLRENTLASVAQAGGGRYAVAHEASAMAAMLEALTSSAVPPLPTDQPETPAPWTRQDPAFWLTSLALLVLLLESLLDVRLPGRALALVRRPA